MKTMTKNLAVVFIAIALAFGFVGCANSGSESGTSSTKEGSDVKSQLTEFPNFSSTDLDGNQVTGDIFSQKKYTVVNFWGTYCSPCIGEMAELGSWANEMDDDAQLIGVVIDATGTDAQEYETARSICSAKGVTFTNVCANSTFSSALSSLVAVPTTVIVDSNRQVVAGPIVGAQVDAYKSALEDLLAK